MISNFGRQLNDQQWRAKMELRSQLVGEPAINYCMDKLAIIREKPGVLLTPTETVTQLIMGLNDPSQKAILYLHHQQVHDSTPVTNPVQPAASATTATFPGTSRTIMKCYNCNLEGHIARNCPMPDRRPSRAANQGNETADLQGQG